RLRQSRRDARGGSDLPLFAGRRSRIPLACRLSLRHFGDGGRTSRRGEIRAGARQGRGGIVNPAGGSPLLLLASASPRRLELLSLLRVPFNVVVSRFDEGRLAHITDAQEYVRQAAESKAREVAGRRAGWILGVDTDVVAPDGAILGKPASAAQA